MNTREVILDKRKNKSTPGTTGNGAPLPLQFGAKLKAARRHSGLSLRALGTQTGFSASFLSQVELGQVSPSLASLDRITHALGVRLSDLLSEPAVTNGPVLRRKEQASLRSEWSRATVQSLLPAGVDDRVAVVLIRLEPGGRSGKSPLLHTGEELAFCVRGKVTVVLDEERYELAEGDSLFYDATQPSRWENTGKRRAEVLLISFSQRQITPP